MTFVADRDQSGWNGVLSSLFPLLDDAYGKRSKFTISLGGNETPGLFEFESLSSESVCSFINTSQLKGFTGLLNKDITYHRSALVSLFLRQCDACYSGTHFKEVLSYLSPLSRNIVTSFIGK
eukprot:sb/3475913/